MGKKKRPATGTPGASSLMVIFAVLCIAVFAVLSLSTALAGKRLEESSLNSAADYYQADCEAERILAQLRTGERPADVTEEDGVFSYSVPISDTRTLEVRARVDGDNYEILSWQSVYTATWAADDKISVWARD